MLLTTSPEAAAREVLDKHWDRTVPVHPEKIAGSMGVQVSSGWIAPLSGQYIAENPPRIVFNVVDHKLRQRFTVAHELGHHILHHGNSFRDPAKNFSLNNYDPKEAGANRFAAELLMPEDSLKFFVYRRGMKQVPQLAETFKVSEQAMLFRLKNLGWVK